MDALIAMLPFTGMAFLITERSELACPWPSGAGLERANPNPVLCRLKRYHLTATIIPLNRDGARHGSARLRWDGVVAEKASILIEPRRRLLITRLIPSINDAIV